MRHEFDYLLSKTTSKALVQKQTKNSFLILLCFDVHIKRSHIYSDVIDMRNEDTHAAEGLGREWREGKGLGGGFMVLVCRLIV